MISGFQWTSKKSAAALALAEGHTQQEVANRQAVSDRTIRNWLAETEFKQEVDRLSLMVDLANRAERMRVAKRIVREKMINGLESDKDLLDWFKYAQSETDGARSALSASLAQLTIDHLYGKQPP